MSVTLAIALVTLMCGCAVGVVHADGEIVGFAVGHAELRYCEPAYSTSSLMCEADKPPKMACRQIRGGYFSSGFAGVIEAAFGAFAGYLVAGS